MKKGKEPKGKGKEPYCPYCEPEVRTAEFAYCRPCDVKHRYCVKCEIVVEREAKACPRCGGELEWR